MKTVYLITIVFLCTLRLAGQTWDNYEYITTSQGLPHNVISALYQDTEGFLWIGTYNGLCRYDGNKIKVYKDIFGPISNGNWYHAIQTIFEDSRHNLWAGTKGGLVTCFNRRTQQWKTCVTLQAQSVTIRCFFEDDSGRIWIGGDGYIGIVQHDTIHYTASPYGSILQLAEAKKGQLIVLGDHNILNYDIAHAAFSVLPVKELNDSYNISGRVQDGDLIVQQYGACVVVRLRDGKLISDTRPANIGRNLNARVIPAASGGYFFANANIVDQYDISGKLTDHLCISDNQQYDKNEKVNCMLEDHSGILWLGTNAGLFKVDRRKYSFKKYSHNNISGRLSYNYIRSLYTDRQNNLWTGYRDGTMDELVYDNNAGRYRLNKTYTLYNHQKSVAYTTNTMLQLHNGKMLAGCTEGLFGLDEHTQRLHLYLPALADSIQEVWSLWQDNDNRIWIGTHRFGLFVADPATGSICNYRVHNNDSRSIIDNTVWNMYADRTGRLWIATDNGLCFVNDVRAGIKDLQFTRYALDAAVTDRLHVWSMAEDTAGCLWLGTTGNGIYKISKDRKTSTRITAIPNNVISGLQFDGRQRLWVSTINGLFSYQPATGHVTAYDEQDGLISNDYNFKALTATASSEMFFGGKMGMVSFYPDSIKPVAMQDAPVKITAFAVNGTDMLSKIYSGKPLQMPHWQNNIEIGLAIPDFRKPRSHTFRYILKGFDKKWHYTDAAQPFATYTNIPPGSYSFMAEGAADGSNWNRLKIDLPLYIRPALWQRPFFWLSLGVLMAAAITLALYYRVRSLIRKEREKNLVEKQIAGLELRTLQLQMDPHFIFNAINAIQHFIVNKDELSSNEYLTRFAKLMRLFLESSKSRYLTLAREAELLELYLSIEQMRFGEQFDYSVQVQCDAAATVLIPSMLIQPFIENAINHGLVHKADGGWLHVSFKHTGHHIRCVIEDNGIGRQRSAQINREKGKKYASRGMELIQERIKTYNFINEGDIQLYITDKQPPGEGTRVELIIPLVFEKANTAIP